MSLPDKPTKHVKVHQAPIGAVKHGKVKVLDGDTGKVAWRQGLKGMSRDWDGDPVSTNYNRSGLKSRPKHSPRQGKSLRYKPHMGSREKAYEDSGE